jgi:hypothetical protein
LQAALALVSPPCALVPELPAPGVEGMPVLPPPAGPTGAVPPPGAPLGGESPFGPAVPPGSLEPFGPCEEHAARSGISAANINAQRALERLNR